MCRIVLGSKLNGLRVSDPNPTRLINGSKNPNPNPAQLTQPSNLFNFYKIKNSNNYDSKIQLKALEFQIL